MFENLKPKVLYFVVKGKIAFYEFLFNSACPKVSDINAKIKRKAKKKLTKLYKNL
jgi:hypothetical protein